MPKQAKESTLLRQWMLLRLLSNSDQRASELKRRLAEEGFDVTMPCDSEDYTEFEIELDASILPNTTFDYSQMVQEASRFIKMTGIPIRVEQMM